MIIDGFTFFNELDVLKIRLEELYPVVDRFVIVEGSLTFRGNPKPFYYEENANLYEKYWDKIHHVKVHGNHSTSLDKRRQSWEREYYQRNQIAQGFFGTQPDDIVIISDVDEIPRRSAIAQLNPEPIQRFLLKQFYYGINVYAGSCGASKATRIKYFTTAQGTRNTDPPGIEDAGWHFSYLGDADHISTKFKSFSHWELDIPEITNVAKINQRMSKIQDLWGQNHGYERVEIDDTYPEAIKDDLEYYAKYIR